MSETRLAERAHTSIPITVAKKRGCSCEYGCRRCGLPESQMGNCPGWDCVVGSGFLGREADPNCPVGLAAVSPASPTSEGEDTG
jgi:hypothetical protein